MAHLPSPRARHASPPRGATWQVRTYVNGTLYSVLVKASLKARAEEIGLPDSCAIADRTSGLRRMHRALSVHRPEDIFEWGVGGQLMG